MTLPPPNLLEDLEKTKDSINWFINELSNYGAKDKKVFLQLIKKLPQQVINLVLDELEKEIVAKYTCRNIKIVLNIKLQEIKKDMLIKKNDHYKTWTCSCGGEIGQNFKICPICGQD